MGLIHLAKPVRHRDKFEQLTQALGKKYPPQATAFRTAHSADSTDGHLAMPH